MRKYNHEIVKKTRKNRAAIVRKQKHCITILLLILVSLSILLGTSMNVFAGSKADISSYTKYYKSIQIEAGDTLWNIADEYIEDLNIDKKEYIAEICELNEICEDEIHAGDYIVIAYYSKDIK